MIIKISDEDAKGLENSLSGININTYRAIGLVIKSGMSACFKREESPDGKAWVKLKSSTLKARKKGGKGAKILRDTGFLLGKSFISTASNNNVEIGFTAPYSVFHEKGTKHIPQRRLLPENANEIDIKQIEDIIFKDILK